MIGVTEWTSSEAASPKELRERETGVPVRAYFKVKRGIDIIGSLLLIVLLLPVLLVACLLVLLDVGPPILFWQERLGWKKRAFLIYKFRTLGAPFGPDAKPWAGIREPSPIGRFLRATRIDELPQLLNVLLGDMSLVGPRPLLPEDQPSNTHIRLSVRPGITGWAQVHGAKLVTKEDKEKLDEWYIHNASLLSDLRIVLMTFQLMLRSRMSSEEAVADIEQVQSRNVSLDRPATHARVIAEERGSEIRGRVNDDEDVAADVIGRILNLVPEFIFRVPTSRRARPRDISGSTSGHGTHS